MTTRPVTAPALAGAVLRAYRGAADVADVAGIKAVRAAVRRADGDVWLPGPDDESDPAGKRRPRGWRSAHRGAGAASGWR